MYNVNNCGDSSTGLSKFVHAQNLHELNLICVYLFLYMHGIKNVHSIEFTRYNFTSLWIFSLFISPYFISCISRKLYSHL